MSLLTFNFCEVDAVDDLDLIVNEIKIPVTPEITENVQEIPGMVGKLFLGNSYGQKIFEIDVTIKADNSLQLADKIHELTDLVMTFDDDEYPMVFSIDPEYTYYGHFTDISKPERITQNSSWRKVTLTFACSDPKGYGAYTSNDMTTNPVSIYPDGSADCYPIFTCIPKKDVNKIAVASEDGDYVFLGADVDPDTGGTSQDLEPLVLTDECNDMSLWTAVTTPTFILDNGVVRGTMTNTATSFRASSFGSPVSGQWHGPSIKRSLPSAYSDFRIRVRLANLQYYPRAMGKIELYLLDSNGARIGKIALKDSQNSKSVYAQVQWGNKDLINGPGTVKQGKTVYKTIKVKNGIKTVKSKGKTTTVQQWKTVNLAEDLDTSTFTDFYGYLELQKIGNKYRVEIMKWTLNSNPGWKKPIVITWTDTANSYTSKSIASVAAYTAMYDIYEDTANPQVHYKPNALELCGIQVWNIINGGNDVTKPQIIARKGDEVKINCEVHKVYKNGAYFMDKFYIGSQFLKMKGGIYKTFSFEPGLNDADWYVEYRPTTS